MLPSISSAAYIGYHLSCTGHQLSFGSVADSQIQIRWKLLAKEYDWDTGVEFHVDTDLLFAGVKVQFIPRRPT